MKKFLILSAFTALTTSWSCAFVSVPQATAATFSFTFNDLIYGDIGSGSLSFTDAESSLAATNGTGIFQLSDFGSSTTFNFSVLSAGLGITHTAPASSILGPLFQFQAGNLVGLSFLDTEPEPLLGIESIFLTEGSLFLIGPGIGGVPILGASFGLINFETVQPWTPTATGTGTDSIGSTGNSSSGNSSAAVPEPATILGVTLAAAAGTFARRRLNGRQQAET